MVLRACLHESSMTISEATIDSLTAALFEAADTDGSGAISFEELKEELEKNPDVMENLTIRCVECKCAVHREQSHYVQHASTPHLPSL